MKDAGKWLSTRWNCCFFRLPISFLGAENRRNLLI